MSTAPRLPEPGARLFARYAYPPNKLGYCGPAESAALADAGAGGARTDLRAVARRFSGAWHYLQVLAELTGRPDPLDEQLVESYWLGGGIGAQVGGPEFGSALLARIGPQAGHYWGHLTEALFDEAAANHCFHVFGVYPWSRLLQTDAWQHPLHVLDSCRIRWGTVHARKGNEIVVRSRRLTWDGHQLGLSTLRIERVAVSVGGLSFVPDVRPGDRVALHWQWLCDRLREDQVAALEISTLRQIEVTNRRLAAEEGHRVPVPGPS